MPARHVIHAVGPVWHGGDRGEAELLASCYRRSLEIAREHGLTSVAFPSISTGVYGYPKEAAAKIAVQTVTEFLRTSDLPQSVIFCCFDEHAAELHAREIAVLEGAN